MDLTFGAKPAATDEHVKPADIHRARRHHADHSVIDDGADDWIDDWVGCRRGGDDHLGAEPAARHPLVR